MTAEAADSLDTVIYALGGGRGHLRRALNLVGGDRLKAPASILHSCAYADEFSVSAAAHSTTLVSACGWSAEQIRAQLAGWARSTRRLVVDTFPGGLAHEVDGGLRGAFGRSVLIGRYVSRGRYPEYEALAAGFDEVWLPYDPATCEWEGDVDGEYIGPIARALSVAKQRSNEPAPWLAVIGDVRSLAPGLQALLPADTVHVTGRFEQLPAAQRYLSVGAGYNIVHELAALQVSARFVPAARRYDDQFHRVGLRHSGVYSSSELREFLSGGARCR